MSDSNQAVFLSYASQDAEAAKRICEALRAAGVEVWFDQNELVGGDAWDQKIRGQIKACALFVPVISAATQARREGYFRLEWKLAAQRTHMISERQAFLLPVVIDGTSDAAADVPEEFRAVQWTRLRPAGFGGQALHEPSLEAFCARVGRLLGGEAAVAGSEVGARLDRAHEDGRGRATPLRKPSRPWVVRAVIVVLFGGALGIWQPWRKPLPLASPAPAASAMPRLGPKSIAVLPFDNLSDDKESGYFADGMQDDVITNLLLIRELRCVPRATAMTYRGSKKSNREIAAELGVAYVLNGTVRRADKKVKITGTLVDARTDEPIWSKPYDKDLTDIFSIQAELAQAIAAELKATLSPTERTLVSRRATEDPAAYDLFLRARTERNNATGGGKQTLDRQMDYLDQAVKRDPAFAVAWAELTRVNAIYYHNNIDHSAARLARAREAIETASRLAPDTPEVTLNLGYYYYYGFRDYDRATVEFEKVIRTQPNAAAGYHGLASVQRRQGKWTEAEKNFRKVVELDPKFIDAVSQLFSVAQPGRRYAEARVWVGRVAELLRAAGEPGALYFDVWRARLTFYETGATEELDALFRRLEADPSTAKQARFHRSVVAAEQGNAAEVVRLDAESPMPYGFGTVQVACALAVSGDLAAARKRLGDMPAQLREQLVREPDNDTKWGLLARCEALLGNRDEALRCARRGVELVPVARDAWYGPLLEADLAFVYAWTGDKERAIDAYARLLALPVLAQPDMIGVHTLKHGIWYEPLRGDPRFEALLADPKNNAPLF